MSHLKSKLMGATTAAAAALFVAFTSPAQSKEDFWRQIEMTDGYTPSSSSPYAPGARLEQPPRSEQDLEFTGTGARQQPTQVCDWFLEQLSQTDGHTMKC